MHQETLVSYKNITREKIKNLHTICWQLTDQPTGWLHQDHLISVIHYTLKLRQITGLMRTDFGTKKIEDMKLKELKCIWCKVWSLEDMLLVLGWLSVSFIIIVFVEPDTLGIHTKNLMSRSSHLVRFFKLHGLVILFSLEDWLSLK